MKYYKIIVVVLLAISGTDVKAQEGWRIGVEAGPLFSRTFFTDTVNDDYIKKYYTGYRVGAIVHWGRSEATGFSLGAHLVNKGVRWQYALEGDTDSLLQVKQGTQFLEIPFCMVFKQDLGVTGFIRESFGIGGAIQFTQYDSSVTMSERSQFTMFNQRSSSFNAFFRLGVEFGNRFDNGDLLTLGAHYQQGFGTVSNQGYYNADNNRRYFNTGFNGSYIAITLGYHFNLSNIGGKEEFFTSTKPKYRF